MKFKQTVMIVGLILVFGTTNVFGCGGKHGDWQKRKKEREAEMQKLRDDIKQEMATVRTEILAEMKALVKEYLNNEAERLNCDILTRELALKIAQLELTCIKVQG